MSRTKTMHLKRALLLLTSLAIVISVFAFIANEQKVSATAYSISDNTNYQTSTNAYNMNSWSTANSYMVGFVENCPYMWFKLTANAGDKLAIAFTVVKSPDSSNNKPEINLYNSSLTLLGSSSNVYNDPNGTSVKYNILRHDIATSGTYYIRIEKTYNLSSYTTGTLSFIDRAKTSSKTASLTPATITNSGNGDSQIASVDLTNDSTIPSGAKVISYTTSVGTFSPTSQAGILHKVKYPGAASWIDAKQRVVGGGGGTFADPTPNTVNVKGNWQFCYNASALASSSMKNVSVYIKYVYDVTDNLVLAP